MIPSLNIISFTHFISILINSKIRTATFDYPIYLVKKFPISVAKYSWKCNGVCACIGTAAAAGVEQNGSEENEEAVVENEAGAAVARGCSVARFGVVAAANIGEG